MEANDPIIRSGLSAEKRETRPPTPKRQYSREQRKIMWTYLVEIILASLGVVDRGCVTVVTKMPCRNEPIATCRKKSALERPRQLTRPRGVRKGIDSRGTEVPTIVPRTAGDKDSAPGAKGVDPEDCRAGISISSGK